MSPELARVLTQAEEVAGKAGDQYVTVERLLLAIALASRTDAARALKEAGVTPQALEHAIQDLRKGRTADSRSEEHTSELQSLMRTSYAVFCLKKKNNTQ